MDNTKPPTDQMINEIFTTFSDDSICQGLMEWTTWRSASNDGNARDGNDYETLADHIKYFG